MTEIVLDRVVAQISEHVCLKNLSLSMGADEHWAIVGANGSGKSSLGRLLCHDLGVLSGSLKTARRSAFVAFETVNDILEAERYNDDSDFLDCVDQGTLVADFILQVNPDARDKLEELARQLDFTPLLGRGIRFLSTGEMRKVVICRALLQEPELLVLDEPFDGLDLSSTDVLKDLIGALVRQGLRIVLLLNRFSEILPFITHVAYIRDCSLFAIGPKETLLESDALQRFHSFHYALPVRLPDVETISDAQSLLSDEPLIEMKDVVVQYDGKKVLNRFSWTVDPGQNWKICGPNGAGKSTLMSLISGDNPQAYANNIRLFGRQRGTGESVWDIKKHIGLVSTSFQQDYRVGVTAEIAVISGFFDSIGVYHRCTRKQRDIALQWLELVHMQDKRSVPLRSLSFGEQRLILLARAMVKQPRLLILDEPCQGLDEVNREMVLKLVDYLARRGHTQLLYVTHHVEDRIPCIHCCLQLIAAEGGGYTGSMSSC